MTLNIAISPETEAMLQEAARSAGKDVEGFVRQVIEEKLMTPSVSLAANSSETWLERFDAWIKSHQARPNVNLDDSRDAIYAGRGE